MELIEEAAVKGASHAEGILELVKRRQEKWLTKLQEMNNDRTTKDVSTGDLEGKRPRGRPPRRWLDNFK